MRSVIFPVENEFNGGFVYKSIKKWTLSHNIIMVGSSSCPQEIGIRSTVNKSYPFLTTRENKGFRPIKNISDAYYCQTAG